MAGSAHTLTSTRLPNSALNGLAVIGEHLTAITGDDATGAVPTLSISFPRDVQLLELETNPGATGPTDNWDVTLVDSDGADVLLSNGLNRDTANSEIASITHGAGGAHVVIKAGSYTLTVGGTAVNSATATIALRWRYL